MFLKGYGYVMKEREANRVGFRELQVLILTSLGRVGTLGVTRSSQLALEGLEPGGFRAADGQCFSGVQNSRLPRRTRFIFKRVSHLFCSLKCP